MGEELGFEMALTTYAVERKRRRLGECCAAAAAVATTMGVLCRPGGEIGRAHV